MPSVNFTSKRHVERQDLQTRWFIKTFKRRECIQPLGISLDGAVRNGDTHPAKPAKKAFNRDERCSCGRLKGHTTIPERLVREQEGQDKRDPLARGFFDLPTNAFGTFEFRGKGDGNKAKYLRLTPDITNQTLDSLIENVIFKKWNICLPNLIISVFGVEEPFMGTAKNSVSGRVRRAIGQSIINVAETTGGLIISNGLNKGPGEIIGDALREHTKTRHSKINMIGISPWGVVANNNALIRYNEQTLKSDKYDGEPSTPVKQISQEARNLLSGAYRGSVPYPTFIKNDDADNEGILNPNCSHFLLSDDGTQGKFNRELKFRRLLERRLITRRNSSTSFNDTHYGGHMKYLSLTRSYTHYTMGEAPLVYVLIGGDRRCLVHLKDISSTIHRLQSGQHKRQYAAVPIVVCTGTGGVADLIGFMYAASDDDGCSPADTAFRSAAIQKIIECLGSSRKTAQNTFLLLRELIMERKQYISIYNTDQDESARSPAQPSANYEDMNSENPSLEWKILEAAISTKGSDLSGMVDLTQRWDRPDIARHYIFPKLSHSKTIWRERNLEQTLFDSLIYDRVHFLTLIMEKGVSMHSFLTLQRLERLYSYVQHRCVESMLVGSVKQNKKSSQKYAFYGKIPNKPTIFHVGQIVEKLMGGAYRSQFTRKKYRNYVENEKLKLQESNVPIDEVSLPSRFDHIKQRAREGGTSIWERVKSVFTFGLLQRPRPIALEPCEKSLDPEMPSDDSTPSRKEFTAKDLPPNTLAYPFTELFIWACLNQREEMANFMWLNGEDAMAKSIMALRIYRQLAKQAEEEDIDNREVQRLKQQVENYAKYSLDLLETCFKYDSKQTEVLLTYEMDNWARRTNLDLAYMAKHYEFFEHVGVQTLLQSLWTGGLLPSRFLVIQIVMSVIFFPVTYFFPDLFLSFKTRLEVENQPQTFEEHLQEDSMSSRSSISTQISTSTSSSSSTDASQTSLLTLRSKGHFRTTRSGRRNSILARGHRERVRIERESSEAKSSWVDMTRFMHGPSADRQTKLNSVTFATNDLNEIHLIESSPFDDDTGDEVVTSVSLSPEKKRHEIFAAPITKYWVNFIGYLIFLTLFVYTVLTPMHNSRPNLAEYYLSAFVITFTIEQYRKIKNFPCNSYSDKLILFIHESGFNILYLSAIFTYIIGQGLRFWLPMDDTQIMLGINHHGLGHSAAYLNKFRDDQAIAMNATAEFSMADNTTDNVSPVYSPYSNVTSVNASRETRSALFEEPRLYDSDTGTNAGRLVLIISMVLWTIGVLAQLQAFKIMGPYVTMIGRMLKDLALFLVILLIVLLCFGVSRQAILNPRNENIQKQVNVLFDRLLQFYNKNETMALSELARRGVTYSAESKLWRISFLRTLERVFHEPYFMLYGEVYAFTIDPCLGSESPLHQCTTGNVIAGIGMVAFLLVANILLLNILIAVFNSTYQSVMVNAISIWKYERYAWVTKMEHSSILPPPFVFIHQLYHFYRWVTRRQEKIGKVDRGLKIFLDEEDVEVVQDFEEERLDELQRVYGAKDTSQFPKPEEKLTVNSQLANLLESQQDMYESIHQEVIDLKEQLKYLEKRQRVLSTPQVPDRPSTGVNGINRISTPYSGVKISQNHGMSPQQIMLNQGQIVRVNRANSPGSGEKASLEEVVVRDFPIFDEIGIADHGLQNLIVIDEKCDVHREQPYLAKKDATPTQPIRLRQTPARVTFPSNRHSSGVSYTKQNQENRAKGTTQTQSSSRSKDDHGKPSSIEQPLKRTTSLTNLENYDDVFFASTVGEKRYHDSGFATTAVTSTRGARLSRLSTVRDPNMDMRASMPSRAIKVNRMTPHYFQRHDETKKWVNEARNQTMILQDMEPDRDDFNAKSSSCNELRILGKDLPKTFRIEKSISRPCDRKLRTRGFSEGPTTYFDNHLNMPNDNFGIIESQASDDMDPCMELEQASSEDIATNHDYYRDYVR